MQFRCTAVRLAEGLFPTALSPRLVFWPGACARFSRTPFYFPWGGLPPFWPVARVGELLISANLIKVGSLRGPLGAATLDGPFWTVSAQNLYFVIAYKPSGNRQNRVFGPHAFPCAARPAVIGARVARARRPVGCFPAGVGVGHCLLPQPPAVLLFACCSASFPARAVCGASPHWPEVRTFETVGPASKPVRVPYRRRLLQLPNGKGLLKGLTNIQTIIGEIQCREMYFHE